jgi:hypothetical protein
MEPDLLSLLSVWSGQEIEPGRHEALLERLGRDPEFRRAFVAEVRMLGLLKVVQAPEPRWLRLEDELGWSASESSTPEAIADRVMRRLDDAPRSRPAGRVRLRWAIAAAAVVFATVAAAIAFLNPRPKGPTEARVAEVRPYPRVDTSTGLAMVVRLDGVSWEPTGEPHPAEGDVLAAGRLRIGSGRAVLSMLTGVVLDVEGPADLDLLDSGRVYCRRGRIRARVPAGAEGFLVLGPGSAVVDLGTEFGLNVEPDGKLRGEVFQGKLEAALLSASGTPQRSFFLDAAQAPSRKAFEIDARAGSIEAVATSDDFIEASHPVGPPLDLDDGYADAVRKSGPWGYWRFESMEGGSVANDVPGRPPLRATGPVRLGAALGGNRWAEFRPADGPQFLELAQPWRPTWRPGFAVEFWCLSESIGHESLVGIVTPKDTDHHVFLMELTSRNRLTIHRPASVRLLHRWPSGWEAGDNAYSQDPYVPYRWHHVVGQVHFDRIELFLDGRLSAALSIRPEHSEVACQLVLGRLTSRPGSGLSIDRPFVGRLDEVALYDRPLSPEEVRDHHRRGAGTDRPR